jgi:hypothetical protein
MRRGGEPGRVGQSVDGEWEFEGFVVDDGWATACSILGVELGGRWYSSPVGLGRMGGLLGSMWPHPCLILRDLGSGRWLKWA